MLARRLALSIIAIACLAAPALATQCGKSSAGFDAWQAEWAAIARHIALITCR